MKVLNDIQGYLADEQGYTLAELLTVIAIAGLLFAMAMSVWVFGQEYYEKWNRNIQIVNKVHVLITGLSNEIYRAREIHDVEGDRLVLLTGKDLIRVYTVGKGELLRNDRAVSHGEIEIVSLDFYKIDAWAGKDEEAGLMQKARYAIGIDLTVAAKNDTLSVSRMVYPRVSYSWVNY